MLTLDISAGDAHILRITRPYLTSRDEPKQSCGSARARGPASAPWRRSRCLQASDPTRTHYSAAPPHAFAGGGTSDRQTGSMGRVTRGFR